MSLTTLGWAVIHSLWQGTLLAGIAALVLSILPDKRARARHLFAYASLIAMAVLPLATALGAADPMGERLRRPVMLAIDDAVGMPVVVQARAVLVPAAAALWLGGVILSTVRIGREWRRAQRLQRLDLADAGEPLRSVVTELCASGPAAWIALAHLQYRPGGAGPLRKRPRWWRLGATGRWPAATSHGRHRSPAAGVPRTRPLAWETRMPRASRP